MARPAGAAAYVGFRLLVLAVGGLQLGIGLWAFLSPRSFEDTVALFPPYNQHLIHDLGAFSAGLGVAVLVALLVSDGLLTALLGMAAASVLHAVSHLLDRSLGGRPSDPLVIAGFAGVVLLLTGARARAYARRAGLPPRRGR